MKPIRSIIIVGKGNVAWHLNKTIKERGFVCDCISSRGPCEINADLVIIAVKDSAIKEVIQKISTNAIVVHTSGTNGMDIFDNRFDNYGVFYPLQTFTKNKELDFYKVPLCIEASNEDVKATLRLFAIRISQNVFDIDSQKRKQIHLSAVFACNFVNHLLGIAKQELQKENIPFEILYSLIDETIEKAKQNNPFDVQTGPAIRNDITIMQKHLSMLEDKEKKIYKLISNNIQDKHK